VLTILADLTPASAVWLSVGGYAGLSVPVLLFPGARLADFDPRPAVRRAIESGRLDPALCAVANARYWAHEKTRQAALSAAVLLLLLTAPKGVTR